MFGYQIHYRSCLYTHRGMHILTTTMQWPSSSIIDLRAEASGGGGAVVRPLHQRVSLAMVYEDEPFFFLEPDSVVGWRKYCPSALRLQNVECYTGARGVGHATQQYDVATRQPILDHTDSNRDALCRHNHQYPILAGYYSVDGIGKPVSVLPPA